MRTLKFRSYDKVEQSYCKFIPEHLDRELYPHIKIEQFTGLTDRKGKEIYEGDIVRYQYREKELSKHKQLCTVIYEPKAAAFLLKARYFEPQVKYLGDIAKAGKNYEIRTYELCEIIGNIYENKDLLK